MIKLSRYLLLSACFFFLLESYSHAVQDWETVPMSAQDSHFAAEKDNYSREVREAEIKNERPPFLNGEQKHHKLYKTMINRKSNHLLYQAVPQEENSEIIIVGVIRDGKREQLYVDMRGDQLINIVIDTQQPETLTSPSFSQGVHAPVPRNTAKRLGSQAMNTKKIKEGTHACMVKNQVLLLTKQDAEIITHYRTRPLHRVKNPYHFHPGCMADNKGFRCPKEFKIELSDQWMESLS